MFSTGLEKQQAITVALAHSVLPNHAFPGGGVSSNSRIKVTKNNELVGVINAFINTYFFLTLFLLLFRFQNTADIIVLIDAYLRCGL